MNAGARSLEGVIEPIFVISIGTGVKMDRRPTLVVPAVVAVL